MWHPKNFSIEETNMTTDPAVAKAQSFLMRLVDYSSPTVGTSAVYKAVEPQIILMSRVWLSLPGNGNPLAADDPAQALADLIGFGTINGPEDMATAVDVISRAFSTYLTDERRVFLTVVGEDTVTTSDIMKIFQTRRDEEVAEQNTLSSRAQDLKTKLLDVANKLGVTLTVVPSAPAPAASKPKLNLFQKLIMVQDTSAPAKVSLTPTAGWVTPPILDETSDDDINKMMRIWEFLFTRKLEPDVVKTALRSNYNLDEEQIKELFSRISTVLTRQIEQSQMITAVIEKDYKLFQGCLNAALELQGMLVEVGKFFGFTVGVSKTTPAPTKSK